MYAEDKYVEQYCEACRDETDQRLSSKTAEATCLQCGSRNPTKSEEDRVGALIERVKQDDAASLSRLRDNVVPLI
jgi:hypothetical protein